MHKHVFTLGLISASLCTMPAMAAPWTGPTKPSTDYFMDADRTEPATMNCTDCCKSQCWLPEGAYYTQSGKVNHKCRGDEPTTPPTCLDNATYSGSGSSCTATCNSGYTNVSNAFKQCIPTTEDGSESAYVGFNPNLGSGSPLSFSSNYALIQSGATNPTMMSEQWAVKFSYGVVKGVSTCNAGPGSGGEFPNDLGARYNTLDDVGGSLCYCKIYEPFAGEWQPYKTLDGTTACITNCAQTCAEAFKNNTDNLRTSMYNKQANK